MFQAPESWPAGGMLVRELAGRPEFSSGCVFAGILREENERISIPRGDHRIYPGDRVFMVAEVEGLKDMARFLRSCGRRP
jgi:Trk K+ transport system NAD-binding subunit